MGELRQLVSRILLQQERQPDMGSEVHSMDGLDSEPCNPCGSNVVDRVSHRTPAAPCCHHDHGAAKIGDIEQYVAQHGFLDESRVNVQQQAAKSVAPIVAMLGGW